MQLHLFDLINNESQAERIKRLGEVIFSRMPIQMVPSKIAWTHSEIMSYYDAFIAAGYEGFILRHIDAPYLRKRSAAMMKFKPKASDSYLIVGIEEATSESGTPLGMIGAFVCVDEMNTQFKVGAGKLSHDERKRLFKQYPFQVYGHHLLVEYQTMSDKNKVPLFSRAVRII
jgi:ATP-dependent DNA ligase